MNLTIRVVFENIIVRTPVGEAALKAVYYTEISWIHKHSDITTTNQTQQIMEHTVHVYIRYEGYLLGDKEIRMITCVSSYSHYITM